MDYGWISLHRQLREHWIWKDPVKLKWWIDILLTVNHCDASVNIGMKLIECKRGQSVMSLQNWASRWLVSKDTVRCFFNLLISAQMITTENLTKTTRITVCKYDSYQGVTHDEQTTTVRQPSANRPLTGTNNNSNNSKNKNNENKLPLTPEGEAGETLVFFEFYSFEEFWSDYDKKVGDKDKLKKKWAKVNDEDRAKIKAFIPEYLEAITDKQYRKDPSTFLNNKSWNDEIINREGITSKNTEGPALGVFHSHKNYYGLDGSPKKTNLPPAFKCAEQYD